MKLKFIFVNFFFLFSFFGESVNLKGKITESKIPPYIIENQRYVSLRSVLKILGCEDSWGRIEDRIFFIYMGKEIKIKINSDQIIVGTENKKIDYPIKEIEGEVFIHLDSFEKILNEIESSVPISSSEKESKTEQKQEVYPNKYVILIDPGHGGEDSGAIGNYGLQEKYVNLDVSIRLLNYLKKKLKKYPYVKIYITRSEDIFLSLEERVQMAKSLDADIFFCVHTNSSRYNRSNSDGFETYYPRMKEEINVLPPSKPNEEVEETVEEESVVLQIVNDLNQTTSIDESKILAEFVQESLAEKLICPDRGAKPGNYYVLKYTPMTSILTEIGFICNPNIELNLRDVEVRQQIGEALGNAIIKYLKNKNVIPANE